MAAMLESEIRLFEAALPGLLERGKGQFALVHGDVVLGPFQTQSIALREGYKRFGIVPFLVREIRGGALEPLHFACNLAPPGNG